jgi:anion-transporting  ArsA/GET3 family ATPase
LPPAPRRARPRVVPARILFVTGKGGTGKSSVAEALAYEAASRRVPALLVRMPAPFGAADRPIPRGVAAKTLDEDRILEAFLTRVTGLGFVARRLLDSATFAAVAAAAPGLRDLVALTAITAESSRRRGIVVVDAPASGHSVPLLAAPGRVQEIASRGPVAREAERARAAIADPRRFTALVVTTPEELAVVETESLRLELLATGVASLRIVANAVWPARAAAEDEDAIVASGLSADATRHIRRRRRQQSLLRDLEERTGACDRIGFVFASDRVLPRSDVAALYDAVAAQASA